MDEENLVTKKPKICNANMLAVVDGVEQEQHSTMMKDDEQFSVIGDASSDCSSSNNDNSVSWYHLPEPILVRILWLLSIKDMVSVSATCRRWYAIANDDFLWKQKLQKHFKIDPSIALKPGENRFKLPLKLLICLINNDNIIIVIIGTDCWKSEYVRLRSHIPFIQTQCLNGHIHQVLHVSFSHNGEMFATCSKDGFVIVSRSSFVANNYLNCEMNISI